MFLNAPHFEETQSAHSLLCVLAENEKRLIKKCRELNAEIVANAAKVQTALKLSEEDQNTIGSLKKEIEKAWKMVDASHEKVREGLLQVILYLNLLQHIHQYNRMNKWL